MEETQGPRKGEVGMLVLGSEILGDLEGSVLGGRGLWKRGMEGGGLKGTRVHPPEQPFLPRETNPC